MILACSGGLDSVAAFHILKDLGAPIQLLHLHHGPGNSDFRDQAMKFVEGLAADHRVPLVIGKSSKPLRSEAEMRNFRRIYYRKFKDTHVMTLAHHQQDLLETRLIRLIRGTGPEGLKSMDFYQSGLFRPFLQTPKQKLVDYMSANQLPWVEDPSNQDPVYFRNWLRNVWLKSLQDHRPGSLNRLSESLDSLSLRHSRPKESLQFLSLADYLSRSKHEQIQMLSLLLKSKGVTEFTLSQLKEVQRQLDKDQLRHSFKCAGAIWRVNAQQITLQQ